MSPRFSRSNPPRVGVVGATGLVGSLMRTLLEERDFPLASLRGRPVALRAVGTARIVLVEALLGGDAAGGSKAAHDRIVASVMDAMHDLAVCVSPNCHHYPRI